MPDQTAGKIDFQMGAGLPAGQRRFIRMTQHESDDIARGDFALLDDQFHPRAVHGQEL
jgi:hypothetical protein